MSENRRGFIRKMGILAGAGTLLPVAGYPALTPDEQGTYRRLFPELLLLPDEDDFWGWVKSSYTASASIINLNNGGVSPQPKVVQDAFVRLMQTANEAPTLMLWRVLDESRNNTKRKLATMLGCSAEEIAINRNATESLDTIIHGIRLQKGDEVVLSRYDYPRMMNAWKRREKNEGIVLKWVDFSFPEENPAALEAKYTSLFTPKTKVVHLTHMINWVGQILPVGAIAEAAKKSGIRVVVDAAHTFAHIDFKIADLHCDYLGTSLHKWLCAPFGTGLIYIKKEHIAEMPALFAGEPDVEDSIRKFEELGTRNTPAELAVANAVEFHNLIGSKRKQERLHELKNYWIDRVKHHPKIRIRSSQLPEFSGALAFLEIEGKDASEIEQLLHAGYRIHVVGINYLSLNGIRITPHVYTTFAELDILVEALLKIAGS